MELIGRRRSQNKTVIRHELKLGQAVRDELHRIQHQRFKMASKVSCLKKKQQKFGRAKTAVRVVNFTTQRQSESYTRFDCVFAAKGSLRVSKRSEDHQLHEKPDKNREREECAQQKQHQAQRRKIHDQRNRKRKKRCAIKMKKRRERRKKKVTEKKGRYSQECHEREGCGSSRRPCIVHFVKEESPSMRCNFHEREREG